ncbi:hypothetical protein MGU_08344 [Metarhizium guizhouense ARSEF 977]|uniref:2EXR domain-containing protein n=1 Tax=Metarhizium guizhouense (strain ARSEF 977) TaxID=1276136 RepID=A0A0B4GXE3_METGA|nr:hypothetical protein MGU_08344 [Metarhizium guizhouense ARSEF 977]
MPTISQPFNVEDAFIKLSRVVKAGFMNLERRIGEIDASGVKTAAFPDAGRDASDATIQWMHMPEMPIFATVPWFNETEAFRFNELPLELRMEIWKLAMPCGRLFEPKVDIRQPQARHQHIASDPLPVTLRWKHEPPALRAVCRESRQASDIIGGFKFGRMGNTRRGYWFNYESDIVYINSDMIDHVRHLDLRRVSSLGFPYLDFKTEQGCRDILEIAVEHALDCRTVVFYFQENYVFLGTAKFDRLADSDLVGNYEFSGRFGLPAGLAEWGNLRQAVYNIWDEHLTQVGRDKTLKPCLVGIDVLSF